MKYIRKYDTEQEFQSDLKNSNIPSPSVSWSVDEDIVHYYMTDSKLVYYGHIPGSVVLSDWSDIGAKQISYYTDILDITEPRDTWQSVTARVGDKIIVLAPAGVKGVYKNSGFDEAIPFDEDIFGVNGTKTITYQDCSYRIYGELCTASGIYNVKIDV